MLYDSQIKKELKILQQINQTALTQQSVENTDLFTNPENFNKKLITVNLIVGYDFQHGTFDPNANHNKGGYINNIVNIIYGGPNQVGVPSGPIHGG